MRTITNNYRDAQILNLGSGGERGPYLVNGGIVLLVEPKTSTTMIKQKLIPGSQSSNHNL